MKFLLIFFCFFNVYLIAMDPLTEKIITQGHYIKALEIKKWFDTRKRHPTTNAGLYWLMDAIYNQMPIPTLIYECLSYSKLLPKEKETRFVVKRMLRKNSKNDDLEIDTTIIKVYEQQMQKKIVATKQKN